MLATLVEARTFMYDIASWNKVLVILLHDHLKVVFTVFLLELNELNIFSASLPIT